MTRVVNGKVKERRQLIQHNLNANILNATLSDGYC